MNMNDIVEVARLIEAQESDNASYQVLNQTNMNQSQSPLRGNDFVTARKSFDAGRDNRKISGGTEI